MKVPLTRFESSCRVFHRSERCVGMLTGKKSLRFSVRLRMSKIPASVRSMKTHAQPTRLTPWQRTSCGIRDATWMRTTT